ncbi:glycine zipper family protein [Limibaculum sp. FT325]|uniref:glycine zipper family protein n=1 Tax=Thermohalobaculum sediminis TaxID=2939436 RepID=UPI0020C07846|nr:glycine zipper family protein [Limibaculum sediminis]MCL5778619.1 glycine zipper family protein [Limibaculum sediminis]
MSRKGLIVVMSVAAITLAGCETMDRDTATRTGTGAAVGAATGAVIGAFSGSPGAGAAIGATVGGAGGFLYDRMKRDGTL